MTDGNTRTINIPVMARVEGEGALDLDISHGQISKLNLRIYEPPRLFEKFLEGRRYNEVPDMVARICGICPVAYQMSAVHAIEQAFGTEIISWVRDMRRVLYCGEWIQSHALHIHLLAAPDFLGYNSVIEMAKHYPEEVRRGMRLQAIGNRMMSLFGGRSVHPVGVCVGGFHHAPDKNEVNALLKELETAMADARNLIEWTGQLTLHQHEQAFTSVALRHPDEYPMNQGRLVSSDDLDINIEDFQQHFKEFQAPHSTALHAKLHDKPYLVGPLARINLNWDRLPDTVQKAVSATGITFPSRNMFHSIIARATEIYYALLEAARLLDKYHIPDLPAVSIIPRAGVGFGCTEAPRGILWHRYELNGQGMVNSSIIIPPTSQNQARIEEDLRTSLEAYGLDQADEALKLHSEKVIRNYDPCISCSTHFLKFKVKRQ